MKKNALRDELRTLVPEYFKIDREFSRVNKIAMEGTFEEEFGGPHSEKEIAKLEKVLAKRKPKMKLPPSYRAFLELFGKRDEPAFDGQFWGASDHTDEDLEEDLDGVSEMFDEFEDDNPVEKGAICLMINSRQSILMVPPQDKNGEMDVVDFDITKEMTRSSNLVRFFEDQIKTIKGYLAKKEKTKAKTKATKAKKKTATKKTTKKKKTTR